METKTDLILKVFKPKEPCPDFKTTDEVVWKIEMTDPRKNKYVYDIPDLLHPNMKLAGLTKADKFIRLDKENKTLTIRKNDLISLF